MKILLSLLVLSFVSASFADIQADVEYLASDRLVGRMTGTAENLEVQDWLVQRLIAAKARPAGDMAMISYKQAFTNSIDFTTNLPISGTNVIAILYPRNVWTEEAPKVLLGAHFDHVQQCWQRFGNTESICNGASDNAASVAVLLSLLEELPNRIQAPVALAFWDGEEKGLLGSDAFAKTPSLDLSQINSYINLDVIGLNLFKAFEKNHFLLGAETGGPAFQNIVSQMSQAASHLEYHQISYSFGHRRSDMSSFIKNGYKIPFVFFSDGSGSVYHTSSDDAKNMNFNKVRAIALDLQKLVTDLSVVNKVDLIYQAPVIDPGSGYALPIPTDVPIIRKMYEKLLQNKDTNLLEPATVQQIGAIHAGLKQMEASGSFTPQNQGQLLQSVGYIMQVSQELKLIP